MDVRQAELTALEFISQAFVTQTEQMQNRGPQIPHTELRTEALCQF